MVANNEEKLITTKVHGVLDYLTGIALILAPNLFGFADVEGAATTIPRILGALIIGQSLITNYELGLAKLMPMKMHLMHDYIVAIFLAASPFLFGFFSNETRVWLPHVMVGGGILAISMLTEKYPRVQNIRHTV